MVDTKLLKRTIAWKGLTQIELANEMGVTPVTLSNKINNKIEFKASEIRNIADILGLDNLDIMAIFMN